MLLDEEAAGGGAAGAAGAAAGAGAAGVGAAAGAAGAQRALRVWTWATSQRCTMAGHPTANDSVSDAAALLRWAASHWARRARLSCGVPGAATTAAPAAAGHPSLGNRRPAPGLRRRGRAAGTNSSGSEGDTVAAKLGQNSGGLSQVARLLQQQPCSSLPGVLF